MVFQLELPGENARHHPKGYSMYLTPETDRLFRMDDYPERLSGWMERFTQCINRHFKAARFPINKETKTKKIQDMNELTKQLQEDKGAQSGADRL